MMISTCEIASGDRVQWFRAEADVQRWQEQGEQKLAELLRTVRSFKKMSAVWKQLAEMQSADRPGAKAYARQKAAMYQRRMEEAEQFVVGAGYKELLGNDANLIRFVREQRAKEAQIFADAVASAPEDLILD
jgi:5,10-methylene-tetrahydrofolate dehydrogenase/methenyl tetrahydrofolate cyclohydrolase